MYKLFINHCVIIERFSNMDLPSSVCSSLLFLSACVIPPIIRIYKEYITINESINYFNITVAVIKATLLLYYKLLLVSYSLT